MWVARRKSEPAWRVPCGAPRCLRRAPVVDASRRGGRSGRFERLGWIRTRSVFPTHGHCGIGGDRKSVSPGSRARCDGVGIGGLGFDGPEVGGAVGGDGQPRGGLGWARPRVRPTPTLAVVAAPCPAGGGSSLVRAWKAGLAISTGPDNGCWRAACGRAAKRCGKSVDTELGTELQGRDALPPSSRGPEPDGERQLAACRIVAGRHRGLPRQPAH